MSKKEKGVIAIAVVLLALAAWLGVSLYANIPGSPTLALKAFYEREVAEDQIMDPLILVGPNVIPLVEKEVVNPRYAESTLRNRRVGQSWKQGGAIYFRKIGRHQV